MDRVIDSHTHLWNTAEIEDHMSLAQSCGHESIGVVCTIDEKRINANPPALACKAANPETVYVFAGLDHFSKTERPSFEDQIHILKEMGVDGIKLIESKPTSRHILKKPMDDPYYHDFFDAVETVGMPVIWHVADPEEFWNPSLLPLWAQEKGWGYDETDTGKEELYREVDSVLSRYPDLRVTFAHFYFLSNDLTRAADFLDTHPTVSFDLAPGVEMLYNISRNPEGGKQFFTRYAERIIYGTDIFSTLSTTEARERSGMVRRWLETDDVFAVSPDADFLLGNPEDGEIVGLSLADDVLDRIYRTNFQKLTGDTPRPLNRERAVEECRRLAGNAQDPSAAKAAIQALT